MLVAMRTTLLLVWFMTALTGFAQQTGMQNLHHLERHARPDPPGTPTPVSVSAFIIDILEVHDVERSFTVDYFFLQSWTDPRLADARYANPREKLDLTLEDIWHPHLQRVNLKASGISDSILSIGPEGRVVYRQRRIDTYTTPLDLREFPFDTQLLAIRNISSLYGPDEIDIVWNAERSGHLEDFSLTGWTFLGYTAQPFRQAIRTLEHTDHEMTGFTATLELHRNAAFYIWKVFFPLGLIAFMAWTVFWIDPANFGGQVAISTASVITLIAFQLSLSELLPRISYLTRVDLYAVGTSILVFLALGESILTARLAKIGRHKLSLAIDHHMRWAYPLVYLIILLLVII